LGDRKSVRPVKNLLQGPFRDPAKQTESNHPRKKTGEQKKTTKKLTPNCSPAGVSVVAEQ